MIVKSEHCKERLQKLLEGIPHHHWPVLRVSYRIPVYPGWKAERQFNSDLHILYVRGGEGVYVFEDGTTLPLKRGTLTMITHNLPHRGRILNDRPLKINGLRFNLKNAADEIITKEAVKPFYFHRTYEDSTYPEQLTTAIHHRFGTLPDVIRENEISIYLSQLMIEMFDSLNGRPAVMTTDPLMRQARELLEHHIDKKTTISAIAGFLGISTRYLQIQFKAAYGMTPKEYLTHQRMNRAYHMLEIGCRVKEAAFTVCFSDQYAFSRQFKQFYGVAPSEVSIM